VVSPLLAEVYFTTSSTSGPYQWRRREATGNVVVVRYADDIVAGFDHEIDARRFWDAMRTRFEQFELELYRKKTRLLERGAAMRRHGVSGAFTFLPGVHVHLRQVSARRHQLRRRFVRGWSAALRCGTTCSRSSQAGVDPRSRSP